LRVTWSHWSRVVSWTQIIWWLNERKLEVDDFDVPLTNSSNVERNFMLLNSTNEISCHCWLKLYIRSLWITKMTSMNNIIESDLLVLPRW
jgi:hypothetical protein